MQNPSSELVLDLPQGQAFSTITASLARLGATMTWSQIPSVARFDYKYKDFQKTFFLFPVAMRGQLDVFAANSNQSTAKVSLTLNWGGMKFLVALLAFGPIGLGDGIVNLLDPGFFQGSSPTLGDIAVFVIVVAGSLVAYVGGFSRMTKLANEDLVAQLRQNLAAPAFAAPPIAPVASPQPAATTAPQQPAPPAENGTASGGAVFEKIKRLGELREAGLITDADFDSQKTELLKQI